MKSQIRRTAIVSALLTAFVAAPIALPNGNSALLGNTAHAAQEKLGPEVSSFFLDNGLQVVVIPDRRAPVVTHMLWYRAGSADEPPGKSGIAHFLEHLMFKGTKTVANGEFSARIAAIGGQENAFTSTDYTGYFQRVTCQWCGWGRARESGRRRHPPNGFPAPAPFPGSALGPCRHRPSEPASTGNCLP